MPDMSFCVSLLLDGFDSSCTYGLGANTYYGLAEQRLFTVKSWFIG